MRENFLHFLWRLKILNSVQLQSTKGDNITLIDVGQHNINTGPDFLNARMRLANQLWAGNIEMHVKASDWYNHSHQKDSNYDNVILQVVWEHDIDVTRKDGTQIPTLELKSYVNRSTLESYNRLFSKQKKWINCENDIMNQDDFTITNWLERLYIERLESKYQQIENWLELTTNNWDAVFFMLLSKSFGLKINAESFLCMSQSFDFAVLRKERRNLPHVEALFFGQAGLLETGTEHAYFKQLNINYRYLKNKYKLSNRSVPNMQFFRLRPSNFPTIRLAQLAKLYNLQQHLFSKIIHAKTKAEVHQLFDIEASEFWITHYSFQSPSKPLSKKVSAAFINLLIINAIVPIKYAYAKFQGKIDTFNVLDIITSIPKEQNSTIKEFGKLIRFKNNAMNSQTLIQLKNEYCDKRKCLHCAIGSAILKK